MLSQHGSENANVADWLTSVFMSLQYVKHWTSRVSMAGEGHHKGEKHHDLGLLGCTRNRPACNH